VRQRRCHRSPTLFLALSQRALRPLPSHPCRLQGLHHVGWTGVAYQPLQAVGVHAHHKEDCGGNIQEEELESSRPAQVVAIGVMCRWVGRRVDGPDLQVNEGGRAWTKWTRLCRLVCVVVVIPPLALAGRLWLCLCVERNEIECKNW